MWNNSSRVKTKHIINVKLATSLMQQLKKPTKITYMKRLCKSFLSLFYVNKLEGLFTE